MGLRRGIGWLGALGHHGGGQSVHGGGRKFPENVLRDYNIYVTCQTDDDIPYILKCAGEDNIVIGTDYGHFDPSSEIDAISVFKTNPGVDEAAMTKILSDNPKTLYGL